jgi:lysyl-tRNA synthetase class 1
MPPEQLRLLFLRPRYNQAIDFDPEGTDAIPRVFDESDRIAAAVAGREVRGEVPADPEHVFRASLVDPDADLDAEAAAYRPPFAHLAMLVQVPAVDVEERVAAEKGEPLTDRELQILEERTAAARRWLEVYAPDRARMAVQPDELPKAARELDAAQRGLLGRLAEALEVLPAGDWTGEGIQAAIFDAAREVALPAGRAFAALYAASRRRRTTNSGSSEAAVADTLPA